MYKPNKFIYLMSLACCCYTISAHAIVSQFTYTGIQIGASHSNYSSSSENLISASTSDDNLAWHVFAGYQMNANFAIEAGFIQYSDVDFSRINHVQGANGEIEIKSADIVGKLIYPINSLADLYIKGGIAYITVDKKLNSTAKATGARMSDAHNLSVTYGLGGSYEIFPNTKFELTWQQVDNGGGVKNSSFYGAGLTMYFG